MNINPQTISVLPQWYLLCLNLLQQDCTRFAYELVRDVRHRRFGVLTPGRDLLGPLEVFLNQIMPDDGHRIATGRLFISVTNSSTKKNEIVSSFESKQELIEAS